MQKTDTFKARLQRQMLRGVNRHYAALHNRNEYFEISMLVLTKPIEENHFWWSGRAERLALDIDNVRVGEIEQRLN